MNYENSELWEAMKTAKYRNTLEDLERLVNGANSLDEVLGIMLNSIVDAVHAEAGTLWYYDYFVTGKIVPKAVYGGGEIGDFRLELGEGVAGGVIKDAAPVMIKDCQSDPRWAGKVDAKTGFQTKSMICVPLISNGSDLAFGSIQIINKTDGTLFDEKDLTFAMNLAKEFSRLYLERASNEIVGQSSMQAFGIDKALTQNDEETALKVLYESLKFQGLDEKTSKKIEKHFLKIYKLVK